MSEIILINNEDNVLICCSPLKKGQEISIDSVKYKLESDLDIGHKIARKALSKGDKVIKYGVSIGSMLSDTEIGQHVHLHNMKSDYISSHTRQSKVGEA
ncbi:UxaA family hydrolase [Pseudoalteromonas phenolica]|uniref:SAF domain protein n=1 Tax=Pseudoalteromonas phenolica TaxID=161398 RepID=A0A0S2K476_9GAMM|nr:UxaA family hydrolase [Pseudoalteromonas phenolica]ALO42867.1 SAF domain protein [Pseudoalteromonas phenolica]MBE0355998.1 hypothetical protein [Pseudoalteromonas phenolica O-BC30]RXE94665.1 altronate hydrolase [Pseudoalteromonas phenolica O-BC30]